MANHQKALLSASQNPTLRARNQTTSGQTQERRSTHGLKAGPGPGNACDTRGATVAAMMQATGWQQHSVRGFLAGVVRKKLQRELTSKVVDGVRIYRTAAPELA